MQITLALVIPVAAVIVLIFALWSVLVHSYDLTHVPILVIALIPLAIAVGVAGIAGGAVPFDPERPADLTALACIVALVAISVVIEVFSHEIVGYRHTMRVVERQLAKVAPSR